MSTSDLSEDQVNAFFDFMHTFPSSPHKPQIPETAPAGCVVGWNFGSAPPFRVIARRCLGRLLERTQKVWFFGHVTEAVSPEYRGPKPFKVLVRDALAPETVELEPGDPTLLRIYVDEQFEWSVKVGADVFSVLTVGGPVDFIERMLVVVREEYSEQFDRARWLRGKPTSTNPGAEMTQEERDE